MSKKNKLSIMKKTIGFAVSTFMITISPMVTSASVFTNESHENISNNIKGKKYENQSVSSQSKAVNRKLLESLKDYFGLSAIPDLVDVTPDHVSANLFHLQQQYQGVDVENAVIAVRVNNDGETLRVYGKLMNLPPTQNSFSLQEVKSLATKSIEPNYESIVDDYLNSQSSHGQWRLDSIIVENVYSVVEGQVVPVSLISFYAENHEANLYLKPQLKIQPNTGEIFTVTDLLNRDIQAGSGLGGNLKVGERKYEWKEYANDALGVGTFLVDRTGHQCVMKIQNGQGWQNNVTVMVGAGSDSAYGYDCSDPQALHQEDLSQEIGSYSPVNDAAFHAQVAFNLYEQFAITQENGPFKQKGLPLIVKARYGKSDNAFWNGDFIGLGDGAQVFYSKVSADTLGHELAHAFLDNYSQINQIAGITMGISESFADIAGEATEYAIAEQNDLSNDWLYSADTFREEGKAARYFEKPSLDGSSIDSPKQKNPEVVAHHLAGPFNKAFFHLINDNPDWDPLIGFDLWITAAANCWVPGMSYEDGAQCLVDSAENFRANNNRLSNEWSGGDIRKAVMLAFGKVDIMTESNQELVALFDYQWTFDEIKLINHSSEHGAAVNYDWDLNGDGNPDEQGRGKDYQPILQLEDGQNSLSAILTANSSSSDPQTYTKQIPLESLYCTPSGFGGNSDYITQVAINGNSYEASTTQPEGYADYTSQPAINLNRNGENVFALTPNDASVNRRWVVYVDLNGDHDFEDDGEKILEERRKGAFETTITLPELTDASLNKTTRMRVVMNWSSTTRPCAYLNSGEHEDYLVSLGGNVIDPPTPLLGFESNRVAGTYEMNFVNTSTVSPEDGEWLWQYKKSSQGEFAFQDFSSSYHSTLDFGEAGEFDIRLSFNTGEHTYIKDQTITIAPISTVNYCAANSSSQSIYISRAFINQKTLYDTLYNITGVSDEGYSYYPEAVSKNLSKGREISIVVTIPFGIPGSQYFSAWIDLNQDNVFQDDEQIISKTFRQNSSRAAGKFTLPATTSLGQTRLRIAVGSSSPSACGTLENGEYEDYRVQIEP